MKRQSVVSSNIKEVGYDEKKKTLEVMFANGAVYEYEKVPKNVFDEILSANSVGVYFQKNIRDVYPYSKK